MALTDQPYLKFYVDDWMNNTNLKFCSLNAHGLMISVMSIMHKSPTYGRIVLKQKFKQNSKQIENFASQLSILLPFGVDEIRDGLSELIENKVLTFEEDFLVSKRMVKDNKTCKLKSSAGKLGGFATQNKRKSAKAEVEAECDNDNGIVSKEEEKEVKEKTENSKNELKAVQSKPLGAKDPIVPQMKKTWMHYSPDYLEDPGSDFRHLKLIAQDISRHLKFGVNDYESLRKKEVLDFWHSLVKFIVQDPFFRKLQLSTIQSQMNGLLKSHRSFRDNLNGISVRTLSPEEEHDLKLRKAL